MRIWEEKQVIQDAPLVRLSESIWVKYLSANRCRASKKPKGVCAK